MAYKRIIDNENDCEILLQSIIDNYHIKKLPKGFNGVITSKIFREFIENKTSYLNFLSYPFKIITTQRIWHIINNTSEIPTCQECGNNVQFGELLHGYRKTCSIKCIYGKISQQKCKITMTDKYGVENYSQTDDFKQKCKETSMKNFGVEYPMQSDEIKTKTTNIKNFGVENYAKTEESKNNVKQNSLEKYGTENPFQSEIIKQKSKNTKIDRYNGNMNYNNRSKAKETWIGIYGCESPMQNDEIFNKNKKSAYSWKTYILPSGNEISYQGYENQTLDILLQTHNENDFTTLIKEMHNIIGEIWYYTEDGVKHKYYPDAYSIIEHKIYETKSNYTFVKDFEKNLLKKEACLSMGLTFEFVIFNDKGKLLDEEQLVKEYYEKQKSLKE